MATASRPQMLVMPVATVSDGGGREQQGRAGQRFAPPGLGEPQRGVTRAPRSSAATPPRTVGATSSWALVQIPTVPWRRERGRRAVRTRLDCREVCPSTVDRQQWVMAYVVAARLAVDDRVGADRAAPGASRTLRGLRLPRRAGPRGSCRCRRSSSQLALLGLLRWWGWPRTDVARPAGPLPGAVVVIWRTWRSSWCSSSSRRWCAAPWRRAPRRPLASDDRARTARVRGGARCCRSRFIRATCSPSPTSPTAPHPRQVLDIWRTSLTPQDAPVIVYFHGGAWTFGDKREQGRPMLHEFVSRGWIVVTSNYRLVARATPGRRTSSTPSGCSDG